MLRVDVGAIEGALVNMLSRRQVSVTLFLGLLVIASLFGCRAFEPEVVIVNRPPETYIIGAPAETSGGYFHYHVFWYGSDLDGAVERFVWALTDTSIQDDETDDDEEDENFDPADNISTLDIGNWTTRTDSVFDFQIGQGQNLSYDMTLHMVAIDDRGDFDRTPARLRFVSNALANPEIFYIRLVGNDSIPFADNDTIAFGDPLLLAWRGRTENIRAYNTELLCIRDTIPPCEPDGSVVPDGLFGFKWRLTGELGGNCDQTQEDCWSPKLWDQVLGDSVSFFADVTNLYFANDGSSSSPFGRLLDSGTVQLMVNTIDMAGVELPALKQILNIVVNYDPQTVLLDGELDPFNPGDTNLYPYYEVYFGAEAGLHAFTSGETVPDNSRVVFKALGRDNPLDLRLNQDDYGVTFQGTFAARQRFHGGNYFEFSPQYSDPHETDEWQATTADGWSADTLSFQVGPFDYAFTMRSLDEHLRRDGHPDTLSFTANFPPCVQCIELLDDATETSAINWTDDCYLPACFDVTDTMYVSFAPADPSRHYMTQEGFGMIWVNPSTFDVKYTEPVDPTDYVQILGVFYNFRMFFHGKEYVQETPPVGHEDERIMAWQYQVDYANDPTFIIKDGGGIDDITSVTSNFATSDPLTEPIFIDSHGVWVFRVMVAIPHALLTQGEQAYFSFLENSYGHDNAVKIWQLTTLQFGPGTIRSIANDQSICEWRSQKGMYHWFDGVRTPPLHGRSCDANNYNTADQRVEGSLPLDPFAAFSDGGPYAEENGAAVKPFFFKAELSTGGIYEGGPPPGGLR